MIYSNFPYNRPTAVLEGVDIKSTSGRGVVVIDGGMAKIRRCYINLLALTCENNFQMAKYKNLSIAHPPSWWDKTFTIYIIL